MTYYARITFQSDASAAERHDDEDAARRWVESERNAKPEHFKFGQVVERGSSEPEVVATCDRNGWR